jgi:hypothetical protein
MHFPDHRRRDPANWAPTAKAVIDGLVDAKVFTDDDHKHLIGPDMRIGDPVPNRERGLTVLIFPDERDPTVMNQPGMKWLR